MTMIAGVDGCRAGWLCIAEISETGRIDSAVHPTSAELIEQPYRLIAIDIPLGLPEFGSRTCDTIARRMLGRRGCCVFPAPIRALLPCRSLADASAVRRRLEGKGMSAEAWGIVPKIRELDRLLRASPSLQERVREVHPEICFMMWNRGVPFLERKKSSAGKATRAALVAARFGDHAFDHVRKRYPKAAVSDDDIHDAFAALWTAERIANGEAVVIPGEPQRDVAGLRMEISY